MVPQTWEDPSILFYDRSLPSENRVGYIGDGDPVDVVELGTRVLERGEILNERKADRA